MTERLIFDGHLHRARGNVRADAVGSGVHVEREVANFVAEFGIGLEARVLRPADQAVTVGAREVGDAVGADLYAREAEPRQRLEILAYFVLQVRDFEGHTASKSGDAMLAV